MYYIDQEIQVRYAETDMMGVVYHANYLIWMEVGRTHFISDLGYNYLEMERIGILAPVTNINISYNKPVKYGDQVFVRTWVKKVTALRVFYRALIVNGQNEICVEAECQVTCVDKDTFKPTPAFKKRFTDWYEKYQEIAVGDNEEEIYNNLSDKNPREDI